MHVAYDTACYSTVHGYSDAGPGAGTLPDTALWKHRSVSNDFITDLSEGLNEFKLLEEQWKARCECGHRSIKKIIFLQSASAAGTRDEPLTAPTKLWEGKPRHTLSSLNLLWCIPAAPSHLGMQAETDVAPVRCILTESCFCTPAEIIFNPAQGEQRPSLCALALPAHSSGPGWQIVSDRLTWVF